MCFKISRFLTIKTFSAAKLQIIFDICKKMRKKLATKVTSMGRKARGERRAAFGKRLQKKKEKHAAVSVSRWEERNRMISGTKEEANRHDMPHIITKKDIADNRKIGLKGLKSKSWMFFLLGDGVRSGIFGFGKLFNRLKNVKCSKSVI